MSIIELFRANRERAATKQQDGVATLWKEYRLLLETAEPSDADADRLIAIADQLGLDAARVELHSQAVAAYIGRRKVAGTMESHETKVVKVDAELKTKRAELKLMYTALDVLAERREALDVPLQIAMGAQGVCGKLAANFPLLFGVGKAERGDHGVCSRGSGDSSVDECQSRLNLMPAR